MNNFQLLTFHHLFAVLYVCFLLTQMGKGKKVILYNDQFWVGFNGTVSCCLVCCCCCCFWGGGGTASDKLMLHFPWCWCLLSSTHAYHFGDREHILRSQWCQKHFGKRLYLFWQVVIRWSSNFVWQWVLKIWTRSCIFEEYYCHWCVNSDLNFILLLPLMCQQRS